METKLNKEELEKVAEIIGDGYKVYGIEENAQCLNFDGSLYIEDILKAADYIRSKHPELCWKDGKKENPPIDEDVLVQCAIEGDKVLSVKGWGRYVKEDGEFCWRLGSYGGVKFNADTCVYFYWTFFPQIQVL